jgi:Protein of unknown function (DUF664)
VSEHAQLGYPEPPPVGDEASTLLGSLERQRATFAYKTADLDAAALQRTIGASTVTLGGLLKHLAWMEDVNFTRDLAGHELPAPWNAADWDGDQDWEWHSAASDTPQELCSLWRDAVDRSRAATARAVADGGMDTVFRAASGKQQSLRRLVVDFIEEYGRHTGHADLIRQTVDGRVGEDPPGRPYPYRLP